MCHKSKKYQHFQKKHAGVVLVISLIFLVLLTLIGITGMQLSGLQEKMASNMSDKNIAFQAAEDALKTAENKVIELHEGKTVFNCLPSNPEDGLFNQNMHENEPDVEAGSFWSSTDVLCVNTVNSVCRPQDARQPKYIIQCLSQAGLYRITAFARGATADSMVILQSVFSFQQPNVL
jgi:type IV pilus assembly protein PilX